jgi:hypothetical protein
MIVFCTDATRWHTRSCTATDGIYISNLADGSSGPKPTATVVRVDFGV